MLFLSDPEARAALVLLAATLSAGCPASVPPGDDVGTDAGAPTLDAPDDTAPIVDTGLPDTGLPDGGMPDAGPLRDPCETAGEMRIRACGFCGEASFTCTDGFWERVSPCLNERECAAGTFETRTNELCGEETRLCASTCDWGTWSRTRPDGACVPGTRRVGDGVCPPMESEFETCDATCEWNLTGVCEDTDGCPGTPRTAPHGAEEVCVPAGTFIRDPRGVAGGRAEIMISAFYIDRYPVTYGRLAECIAAGVCPDFSVPPLFPRAADLPVQDGSAEQGIAFCDWDGGRRLPTEAEWEKAGRGPSPRENRMPWDGTFVWPSGDRTEDCRNLSCDGPSSMCRFSPTHFDWLCGTRSYYGTEMQVAGPQLEIVSDYFRNDWYSDPRSILPDPEQTVPLPGGPRVARGGSNPSFGESLSERNAGGTGFRCARDAE